MNGGVQAVSLTSCEVVPTMDGDVQAEGKNNSGDGLLDQDGKEGTGWL
jgi:hypothetical protein